MIILSMLSFVDSLFYFVLFWFGFFQEVKFCNGEIIMIIFRVPLFFKNKQTPGIQGS